MTDPTTVKTYTVEHVGDVLIDKHGAATIRFESTAHEQVSVPMGKRLLEHLLRDIQAALPAGFARGRWQGGSAATFLLATLAALGMDGMKLNNL